MIPSAPDHSRHPLSRRDLLKWGGGALAASTVAPSRAWAQAPKRGGTLSLRLWDPPHFDLHAAGGLSYKLHIPMSFTHSRLVRHKTGPAVVPGPAMLRVRPDGSEQSIADDMRSSGVARRYLGGLRGGWC